MAAVVVMPGPAKSTLLRSSTLCANEIALHRHLGPAAAELVGEVGAPQQGAGAALPRLRQQPLEQRLQLRVGSRCSVQCRCQQADNSAVCSQPLHA